MTQPTPTLTPGQRMALALQRIDASRTQLILTLAPTGSRQPTSGARPAPASGAGVPPQATAFSASLAEHLTHKGVGKGTWQALTGAATDWLGAQPWYASVELVASTLVHQAKPVVRKHPWLCLGAAAATGAALVALRPWGWQPVQHRMAPWRSQVGSLVWGQLTQAPVQMALAGALAAWLSGLGSNSPQANSPAPRPSPPPQPEVGASETATGNVPTPHAPAATPAAAASPGVMPTVTTDAAP